MHIGRLLSSEQPDKQLNVWYTDEIWAEKAFSSEFYLSQQGPIFDTTLSQAGFMLHNSFEVGCIFDYSNNSAPLLAFHMPERSAAL